MEIRPSRILVVDEHPLVRVGLTRVINSEVDLEVCDETDVRSFLQSAARLKPNVIITDVSLNDTGFEILTSMRKILPAVKILVLSMHDEMIYAKRALEAGANGYISKQNATENILVAVRRVLNGEVYVSERVDKMLQKRSVDGSRPMRVCFDNLSGREMEVFRMLGECYSMRQISIALHLSLKTVETYHAHLKQKLGSKNARELIQKAVQWNVTQLNAYEQINATGQEKAENKGKVRQVRVPTRIQCSPGERMGPIGG